MLRAKQELAQEKGLGWPLIWCVRSIHGERSEKRKIKDAQTETIREKSFVLLMFTIMEIFLKKFQQSLFYFYWYQVIDNTSIICHYNSHRDPIILDHIPSIKQFLNTYIY